MPATPSQDTSISSPPLWNRNFVLWLVGTAQSSLGAALAGLALSFLVLRQTGSAEQMAVTLACSLAPNVLGPLAGAWIDRVNLKLPLVGADALRCVLQLMLGLLALTWGDVPLWLVNAIALLMGLAGVVALPAAQAAVPLLVGRDDLTRANGITGGVSQTAGLVGVLAGGAVVASTSPPVAILLGGAAFGLMAVVLLFVRLPPRPGRPAQAASVIAEMGAGFRLMERSRLLITVPVIAFVLNAVLVQGGVILPKLMDTLGVGAAGYGLYSALNGVGMVLASGVVAVLSARLPLRRATAAGFVLLSAGFAVMWLRPHYPVLLGCGVLTGVGSGFVNTPLFTLIQRLVPQDYLGRIFSVLLTSASLGMTLSLFALAPALDRLPMPMWFGINAAVLLLALLAWTLVVLSERTLPDLHANRSPEQPA